MIYIEPDFYGDFKCLADKCRHSCCLGWEIDIDEDSFIKYNKIPGELGQELRKNISCEGSPHFILAEHERCPFLRADGLCRLICEKGEDILCDICKEHPRFYNFYESRQERGLGLCCEKTVELLTKSESPLKFRIYMDDGQEREDEPELIFRDRVLSAISKRELPLYESLESVLNYCKADMREFNFNYWAELFLSFEQMDESWTELLNAAVKIPVKTDVSEFINKPLYERLISYFIYRHFGNLCCDYEISESLIFCILSGTFIAALDCKFGCNPEHIRLYSSEIEYSDENISLIMDKIIKTQL